MPAPVAVGALLTRFGAAIAGSTIWAALAKVLLGVIVAGLLVFMVDLERWALLGLDEIISSNMPDTSASLTTDWISDISGFFFWAADILHLWTGLEWCIAAMITRFLIRRLPVIG